MLGIAVGCIGLGTAEFGNLTPGQFDAIYGQWHTRQVNLDKQQWEQTRWLMWAALRPHSKRLKATDIMQFEWEKQQGAAASAEKSTRERYEQLAALWSDKKQEDYGNQ